MCSKQSKYINEIFIISSWALDNDYKENRFKLKITSTSNLGMNV